MTMKTASTCWSGVLDATLKVVVFLCLFSGICSQSKQQALRQLPPLPSSSSSSSLCRRCKQAFNPLENTAVSCRYHRGRWIGAELSKHLGTRSGGPDQGLALFWDCCDEESFDGPGCMRGKHISYDQEEDALAKERLFLNIQDQPS